MLLALLLAAAGPSGVAWRTFDEAAFAEARATRKLVISISAPAGATGTRRSAASRAGRSSPTPSWAARRSTSRWWGRRTIRRPRRCSWRRERGPRRTRGSSGSIASRDRFPGATSNSRRSRGPPPLPARTAGARARSRIRRRSPRRSPAFHASEKERPLRNPGKGFGFFCLIRIGKRKSRSTARTRPGVPRTFLGSWFLSDLSSATRRACTTRSDSAAPRQHSHLAFGWPRLARKVYRGRACTRRSSSSPYCRPARWCPTPSAATAPR